MKYPTLVLLVPFIFGIILADYLSPLATISTASLVVAMVVLLLTTLLLNRRQTRRSFTWGVVLLALVGGMTRFQFRHQQVAGRISDGVRHIEGVVCEPPQAKQNSTAVVVRTDDGTKLMVYVAGGDSLKTGHFIDVFSRFGTSTTWETKSLPHQDNAGKTLAKYRKHLYYNGISATCYADSDSWRVISPMKPTLSVVTRLHILQSEISDIYASAGFDSDEGAVIEAMTTGNRTHLAPTLRQKYSQAGTSHVLALSGLHLMILYGFLELILIKPLSITAHGRRWRLTLHIIILLAMWAFVAIAGMPSSLLRAATMCSLHLIGTSVSVAPSDSGRKAVVRIEENIDEMGKNRAFNVLVVTALLMLTANPFMLFDVGFQLSMLSMLGIIISSEHIFDLQKSITIRIPTKHVAAVGVIYFQRTLRVISGWAMISLVCSVITMPLVAYYFGSVSVVSVFSNMIVTPLATLLLWGALIWWLVQPWAYAAHIVGIIILKTATSMNTTAEWFAAGGAATIEWHPSVIAVILSYILIFVMYRMLRIIAVR